MASCRPELHEGGLRRAIRPPSLTDLAQNWPHDATLSDQHVVVAEHPEECARKQRPQPKPGKPSDGVAPNFLTDRSPHAIPHADSDRRRYRLEIFSCCIAGCKGVLEVGGDETWLSPEIQQHCFVSFLCWHSPGGASSIPNAGNQKFRDTCSRRSPFCQDSRCCYGPCKTISPVSVLLITFEKNEPNGETKMFVTAATSYVDSCRVLFISKICKILDENWFEIARTWQFCL